MIVFDVSKPNPHGFIDVRALDDGASSSDALITAIVKRYPDIEAWRHPPTVHSEQDFESAETHHWCVARFVVRERPQ